MTMKIKIGLRLQSIALMAGLLTGFHAANAEDGASTNFEIDARLKSNLPALETLYRDLHSHPELGLQEKRTAALLAARMRSLGLDVTENVGGTGVVAIFRNGPGPVVMVRTEMDALPVEEKTGVPYASRVRAPYEGMPRYVSHMCGHDLHMTWWVGTATLLSALKDRWKGTLVFIAQPAEEAGTGAAAMLKDGLFTRFPKPQFAFAAHVVPGPAGTISVKDGTVTSADDSIRIVFKGRGGHGSMPSETIDPIVMGARFVTDVQSVVSRQKRPGAFGVISVGMFRAGEAENIIPDEAELKLTVRSFDSDVRKTLVGGIERTARATAEMAMAPPPVIDRFEAADSVINDHALFEKTARFLQTHNKADTIVVVPASEPGWSASEDYYAFIQAGVPSVYMTIGAFSPATIKSYSEKGVPLPTNHSPLFAPDPQLTIPTGIRALSLSVLAVLGESK